MSVAGSAVASVQVVNRLIEGLPRAARNRILKLTEPVNLTLGAVLCEANQRLQHVYFPLTGFISLVAIVNRHPPLEIGLIGYEGMLGATLALGVNGARLRGIVQGAGTALRMTAWQFRLELRSSYSLRRTIDHYLFVLLAQQSRTIACTRFHEINTRLARRFVVTGD